MIVGYKEELRNDNEAIISETGRTTRSSHQQNKIGKGTLGAWIVRGLTAFEGKTFEVGSGIDAISRKLFWNGRDSYIGKIIKFKYFSVGIINLPRHAAFLGFRDSLDM